MRFLELQSKGCEMTHGPQEKSREIKELTVKGLQPEIERLLAKHKAEIRRSFYLALLIAVSVHLSPSLPLPVYLSPSPPLLLSLFSLLSFLSLSLFSLSSLSLLALLSFFSLSLIYSLPP
jgi:hypothetical protein